MKLAGKTDVGSVRPENQDDYRAGELNSDAAWGLVCDGMGGARGGREASVSACDVIEHIFHEQYAQCLPGDEEKFLKRALINANRFVFQKASREEELAGMGTTAVCALVRGGNAFICHAGDSRAYLVRDGRLTQLTHGIFPSLSSPSPMWSAPSTTTVFFFRMSGIQFSSVTGVDETFPSFILFFTNSSVTSIHTVYS